MGQLPPAHGQCLVGFFLSLQLFRCRLPAFFAAALWAVHPIGTESVTNIAGRADLLAAMAVLGGLLIYVRGAALPGLPAARAAAALFVAATVGVFSKENAAVLPGLMLLWDIAFGTGAPRQRAWPRVELYGAVAVSLALLWWVRRLVFEPLPSPENAFLENPIQGAGFWTARLTAIKVIGLDLRLLAWPAQLSCDRSYNQIPLASWSDPLARLALVIVTAILAVVLTRYRKDRLIFFAAGFFGITLLPTANLLFPIGSIMGERFLYLPSVGFAIAVVALAYRLERGRFTTVVLTAVIVLAAARTFGRNFTWRDDLALFSSDVRTAPNNYRLHDYQARALFRQDPVRNLDRVIQEAENAWDMIRSLPLELIFPATPSNLGGYYTAKGDFMGGMLTAQGRAWYQRSLAVLLHAREIDRARETKYQELLAAHGKPLARSGYQKLYGILGLTYTRLGRSNEALEAYRFGRALNPAWAEYYDVVPPICLATGNSEGARIALVERTLVLADTPDTIGALRTLYGGVPGGSCAIDYLGSAPALNVACPPVRNDLCQASADLAQAFLEARKPDRASEIKSTAIQRYDCPARAS